MRKNADVFTVIKILNKKIKGNPVKLILLVTIQNFLDYPLKAC